MKHTLSKLTVAILMTGAMFMSADHAKASGSPADAEALERRSKEADSPKEHAQLAKEYRLRAEELEAKAEKHLAKANELRKGPPNPMSAKWPAMANSAWKREEQLAMQARRAAEECRQQAARHIDLAVEAQLAP